MLFDLMWCPSVNIELGGSGGCFYHCVLPFQCLPCYLREVYSAYKRIPNRFARTHGTYTFELVHILFDLHIIFATRPKPVVQ